MIKQFHHSEFLPLSRLIEQKQVLQSTISLVIPTLNEAKTVGQIIERTRLELIEQVPLLDEIIVMDGDSDDGTVSCARNAGAQIYNVREVGDFQAMPGKGTALWKSLHVAKGDIIVCIDADIRDFDTRFVYGLVAPLLFEPGLSFIKGYYKRPFIMNDITLDNYGGRVTEILVRPLLSTFYPELAGLFQPLAGEYGFRKAVVSELPFFSGYGVEIGLILDIVASQGLAALAQVDMDVRRHRNRNVNDLGKMAFGILHTILKRLEESGTITFSSPIHTRMIYPGQNGCEETVISQMELPPFSHIQKGIVS